MKKLLSCLSLILFVAFAVPALAYDMRLTSQIPLPDVLTGIAVNPETGIAAAISSKTKSLYFIDTKSGTVTDQTSMDHTLVSIAIDPGRNAALVSSDESVLYWFDLKTGAPGDSISVDGVAYSLAIDSDKGLLYIGNDRGITVMDLKTYKVVNQAATLFRVTGIAVDSRLGYLIVQLEGVKALSLYDLETLQPITNVQINATSSGISVNQSTHVAVLANDVDSSIAAFSLETKAVMSALTLTERSYAVAIDGTNNVALVATDGGITIVQLENSVPRITSIEPQTSRVGDSGVKMSITGSKFVRDTQTQFNGKGRCSFFGSNETLQADISADELTKPGDVPVFVTNPPPGGRASNVLTFRIYNPAPVLDSVSPDTVAADTATKFRVFGKNFFNGSTVNLNGENLKTRFISSILLEAQIDQDLVKQEGTFPVVVINPSPGSYTSNVKYLTVAKAGSPLLTEKAVIASQSTSSGTGSLRGRIVNTSLAPLEGVTIRIKNVSVQTDADGNFLAENVPAGRHVVLVDGSTEKGQDGHYPTIPLTIDIQTGGVTDMPFQVYLHRQKNYNFKDINPDEDTVLTDPEVPGFEMRIPKGDRIIGWDGQANLKVSVRTVPTDRLPVKPLPNNAFIRTVYMFYFNKIGGGTPDKPIPVKARNDLGLLPGEKAILWYYDESPIEGEAPNDWAIAGTGTVTPDGKYIVSDPGVGIPKFCCGATAWGGQSAGDPASSPEGAQAGDPVDLATGYYMYQHTDLHIPGIIPINIKRYYRNRESGSAVTGDVGLGEFGKGTYFEYDWWLNTYQSMLLLVKPGNQQYSFSQQQAGAPYTNTVNPEFRGAAVTLNADGTKTLRMRDGTTYLFNSNGELIQITDRNGNYLTITRIHAAPGGDEGGRISSISTSDGKSVTFNSTYTGNLFRIDSITDYTGRTIQYTYETDPFSSYPRLKTVTLPDGGGIQYGYDSQGRMSTVTNGRGIVQITSQYDSDNRVAQQTLPDGAIYSFTYNAPSGSIVSTTMTAPNGSQTTWQVNDYGYTSSMTDPDGTTTYQRAAGTNEILSVTDPLNRTTSYTYYSTMDSPTAL
jgi:YD repeat-containing protein